MSALVSQAAINRAKFAIKSYTVGVSRLPAAVASSFQVQPRRS